MDAAQRRTAWSAAWGILALLFGGAAVPVWMMALTPESKFPLWPAWILAVLTVAAVYVSFSYVAGRWPAAGRGGQKANVDLMPEQVDDSLRLMLENRGPAAEFSVQVISIRTPMGKKKAPQNWTIPWLEDGSTGPRRILAGARQTLDFARYDADAVTAELGGSHDGAFHWWFPTSPHPIGARYYNLLSRKDLEDQEFTLVVRIMNASSGNYLDRKLIVGTRNDVLVCDISSVNTSE